MNHKDVIKQGPIKVFCLEDNPLILFYLEQILEDLGYVFAGSAISFADLQDSADVLDADGALVDIDLADGPTGPDAASWLSARGIPCLFLTGQEATAAEFSDRVIGTIHKPVSVGELARKLKRFRGAEDRRGEA